MILAQIVSPALKTLLEKMAKNQMPIASAWKIKSVIKEVAQEIAKYEEMRVELVRKYAKKDESGEYVAGEKGGISVDPEQMTEFTKEFNELLNLEATVTKIRFTDLPMNLELSPEEALVLEAIIE